LTLNAGSGRVVGRVRGAGDKIWRASVTLHQTDRSLGGIAVWDVDWASCSGAVGVDCEHAAALLFESNERAVAESDVLSAADLQKTSPAEQTEQGIPGLSWRQGVQELLPTIDTEPALLDVAIGIEGPALHNEPS